MDKDKSEMRVDKKTSMESRSQVVFFRLSVEEYELMRKASEAAGSKSLSSFARFAVLFWLNSHSPGVGPIEEEVQRLRAKFMDFEVAFRQFMRSHLNETGAQPGEGLIASNRHE